MNNITDEDIARIIANCMMDTITIRQHLAMELFINSRLSSDLNPQIDAEVAIEEADIFIKELAKQR